MSVVVVVVCLSCHLLWTLFLDQLKLSNRPRNVFRMGPVLGSVLKFEPNECEKIFENIMINNHKYNLIEVR